MGEGDGQQGARLAGLVLGEEIGRGGMGVVIRAHDPVLDRPRAVKLLSRERSSDPEFERRFRRESRLAAALEHPNVVPVHAAGEADGRLYLVMRLVEGPSLYEVLRAEGRLVAARVAAIVTGVAAALDAAHRVGLIHRDVKPANILLEQRPEGEHAYLCDFGISKLADASTDLTASGQFMGSIDYVAPEQIRGERVGPAADVYSLACVAFHALTGSPPFGGRDQIAAMFAHTSAPRPLASEHVQGLPVGTDELLARGMAIDPAERPASAGELAAALGAIVPAAGELAVGRIASAAPPDRESTELTRKLSLVDRVPRRGMVGLALAVLALGALSLAVGLTGGGSPGDPAGASVLDEIERIEVPAKPRAVEAGEYRIWSASPRERVVSSIDTEAGEVERVVEVGGEPVSVALGFDFLWVADRANDELVKVDPKTGEVVARIAVGDGPVDVATTETAIWVAAQADDSVVRLDPSGRITGEVRVGRAPSAIAADEDEAWVANAAGASVSRIDADSTRLVGNPIEVGQNPLGIALSEDAVWVIDNFSGTLTRIDRSDMTAGEPQPVGPRPRGVAAGSDYAWAASREDGTITRFDIETGEPGPVTELGGAPTDISLGRGGLWTANFGDSTVSGLERR